MRRQRSCAAGGSSIDPAVRGSKRADDGSKRAGEHSLYEKKAEAALQDGSAFQKLRELVRAQGGDDSVLEHPERFPQAKVKMPVLSPESGFIIHMDAELIGRAAMLLGAGRVEKEGAIDPAAGIVLRKKTGDFVHRGNGCAAVYQSRSGGADCTGGGAVSYGDPFFTNPAGRRSVDLQRNWRKSGITA